MICGFTMSGFQDWLVNNAIAAIICITVFLGAKHFFKGETVKVVVSVLVAGGLYFLIKNTTLILNALGEVFRLFIG